MGLAGWAVKGGQEMGSTDRGKVLNLVSSCLVSSSSEAISPFRIEGKNWLWPT